MGVDRGVQRVDALTTQLTGPGVKRRWRVPVGAGLVLLASSALLWWRGGGEVAPVPVAAPRPPSTAPVVPAAEPQPATAAPAKGPADGPARVVPSPRPAVRTALVKFRVKPWANVWLDGKKLGIAPFDAQVPVGRHTFEVRNPELEATELHVLEVVAGGENVLDVDLHPPN